MFTFVSHWVNLAKSSLRERKKAKERSPHWAAFRDNIVKIRKTCAACGGVKQLEAHHIRPFHLHPELELEPKNIIVLCMAKDDCHLKLGHGGSFKAFNPTVVVDAADYFRSSNSLRPDIIQRAKKNRLLVDAA